MFHLSKEYTIYCDSKPQRSGLDIFSLKLSLKESRCNFLKGPLPILKQFLATESPLKVMKNTFYFTLKALFVLKIFFVQTFFVL